MRIPSPPVLLTAWLLLLNASATALAEPLPRGAVSRMGTDNYRGNSEKGIVILPDNRTLVTSSGFCDLQTGEWIRRFPAAPGHIMEIRLSPTRDRITTLRMVSPREAGTLQFWLDTWSLSGEAISSIQLPAAVERPWRFTFLPEGRQIVTAGDGTIHVRDAETGKAVKSQRFERGEVVSLEVSPDGSLIACSDRYTLWLWKWKTDEPPVKVASLKRGASAGAFSPDGRYYAAEHGHAFGISLIEVSTGKIARSLVHEKSYSDARSLAFSADGKRLFSPRFEVGVDVWNVDTGVLERTIPAGSRAIKCVSLSSDGKWLVAGGGHQSSLAVWDTSDWKALDKTAGHKNHVLTAAFSPDGTRIASGSMDLTIRIWEAATGRELMVLTGHEGSILKLAFSPDGTRLASQAFDDSVRLWDLSTGKSLTTLRGHGRTGRFGGGALVFSDDGVLLTSLGPDLAVRRWNLERSELSSEQQLMDPPPQHAGLGGLETSILPFSIDRIADVIALCSSNRCRVIDAKTGQEVRSLPLPANITRMAAAGDGRTLALVKQGEPVRIALPNGKSDFEASEEFNLLAMDVVTGPRLMEAKLPKSFMPDCSVSPDGRWIAAAINGPAGPLLVYETATGALKFRIDGHPVSGYCLCFSADSSHIVTATNLGVLTLWDLSQFAVEK